MSPTASTHGLSFDIEVPSSLPSVCADKDRLEQVITNLLTNAFKFTPQGGTVSLRAKEKDTVIMVELQDTGLGIAKEKLAACIRKLLPCGEQYAASYGTWAGTGIVQDNSRVSRWADMGGKRGRHR